MKKSYPKLERENVFLTNLNIMLKVLLRLGCFIKFQKNCKHFLFTYMGSLLVT